MFFGRLALACAGAIALALSQGSAAAMAATQHQPPTQQPLTHRPFAMHTSHIRLDQDPNFVGPKPCSRYYGQKTDYVHPDAFGGPNPYAVCGYTPDQLRDAYGVTDSGLGGAGQTVAVVDAYASPTMLADADRYAATHGQPGFRPGQFRQVTPAAYNHLDDGVCEAPSEWSVEESLDVEAVHAMAPQADIVYVAAASCDDTDLMAALATVVDQRLATIVSDSWGGVSHSVYGDEDPAVMTAYDQLFQRGAGEGISFLFASGDCGTSDPATACGTGSSRPQTSYPAEDPWVTAVGGTTLGVGDDGRYLGETAWGDTRSVLTPNENGWTPLPGAYRFGSGGGTSEDVPEPAYQQGVVPQALTSTLLSGAAAGQPMRVLPDVSMDADPMTGFLVGLTQQLPDGSVGYGESSIGGTSLATPLFAGLTADAEQYAGHPLGFLNPSLYAHARTKAFHDVTAASLDPAAPDCGRPLAAIVDLGRDANGVDQARLYRLGDDGALTATRGYDDVTGLGAPTGAYLHSYRWPPV